MDRLTMLANKYKCDKGSIKHNYTKIYDTIFNNSRSAEINFLEIGFGTGASSRMWLEYFKRAKVYCIDIRESLPEDAILDAHVSSGRFNFISANQVDCEKILDSIGDIRFEFILDDGSHVPEDQHFSLGFLFPCLAFGGIYVIEDIDCKRSHSKTIPNSKRIEEFVLDYNKYGRFDSKSMTAEQLVYLNNFTRDALIHDGKIAFINKIR